MDPAAEKFDPNVHTCIFEVCACCCVPSGVIMGSKVPAGESLEPGMVKDVLKVVCIASSTCKNITDPN